MDTALDTLSRALGVDGCWIQVITPSSNRLVLSAHCGFTPYIQDKMGSMDLKHPLAQEVAGIGNTVIIRDLSHNSHLGLSMFTEAGFGSLIAAPIMTYRVNGIMGVAYRAKKRFTKDDSDLIITIAGMIGMALNKCVLLEQMNSTEKSQVSDNAQPSLLPANKKEIRELEPFEPEPITSSVQPRQSQIKENSEVYNEHLQRMRFFINSHRYFNNK